MVYGKTLIDGTIQCHRKPGTNSSHPQDDTNSRLGRVASAKVREETLLRHELLFFGRVCVNMCHL